MAIVITNSRFTQSIIVLASEIGVDLIDRDGIANIFEQKVRAITVGR